MLSRVFLYAVFGYGKETKKKKMKMKKFILTKPCSVRDILGTFSKIFRKWPVKSKKKILAVLVHYSMELLNH